MKRTMIYVLAISALCAALLTGCGETRDDRNNTINTPNATEILPDSGDLIPNDMEPDANNGIVNDTNGLITGDEAGDGADSDTRTGYRENGNTTGASPSPRP